jgi:phage replication O-like protein O
MVDGDSIQIDKGGYVRVHHAIFELLAKAPLRGQQFRCLMFLFRKTYGFNKKEEQISLAQWAEGTEMKRQNVWRELQLLIKCRVIYMKSTGPKRANTWGFNKRHEQWNLESVITGDYSQSVVTRDYSDEPSVITGDDKSVITPHEHTKDSKDSSAATAKPCTISDFVQAYQTIWGLTIASPYIGEEIKEWEQSVTLDGWRYALKECADTRNIGNWKYFRKILERLAREGYQPQAASMPATASVSFALEELV